MVNLNNELQDAFDEIFILYGEKITRRLEQLYRNESAHFSSGNWKLTFSPGMEATTDVFPYGWLSLANYWIENPLNAPVGVIRQIENTSSLLASRGERLFLKFASPKSSILSVAYFIKGKKFNWGRWFSTNPKNQKAYCNQLDKIKSRYVVKIVNN